MPIKEKRRIDCGQTESHSISSAPTRLQIKASNKSYEDNFVLIFTKVYGPFLRGQREDFWEELTNIRGFWTDSWCVHEGVNMLRFRGKRGIVPSVHLL